MNLRNRKMKNPLQFNLIHTARFLACLGILIAGCRPTPNPSIPPQPPTGGPPPTQAGPAVTATQSAALPPPEQPTPPGPPTGDQPTGQPPSGQDGQQRPDLAAAAQKLGITEQELKTA